MSPARLWAVLLLAGAAASLTAQAAPADDPQSWLGLTPEAAYALRGAPSEVYPAAIDETRWQVVHFYGDHSYLFWASNRVWQVRLDRLWTGSVQGITLGQTREQAEALLGPPAAQGELWSVWNLPHQSFPRRLRLVYTDGAVADVYLYRSEL